MVLHRSWRILSVFFAGFFVQALISASPQPKIILTTKSYALSSDKSFSCAESRINGTITWAEPMKGDHKARCVWYRPDGQVEGTNVFDIENGRQTSLVWLQFGKMGGSLSSVLEQDVSHPEYGGDWRIQIYLDDKLEIDQKLNVGC